MTSDAGAIVTVTGYRNGEPYPLDVVDLGGGHYVAQEVELQALGALEAAAEDGLTVRINSAFRTIQRQTELYEGHQKDPLHFAPADQPGHSMHQQGRAMDLHFDNGEAERERFSAMALAWGFVRPHAHEPWHFEIVPQKAEEVA